MIYISPTGSFDNPRPDLASNDGNPLAKVQIENSIELGWKKEDILLVTNFEYQYGDVKSLVLKNVPFFDRKPQGSKINAIIEMFEKDLVLPGETYWFHDLDAFQLEEINPSEIDISDNEIALTDYAGGKKFSGTDRWSTGVIFFKSGSKDIFDRIKEVMYAKGIDEEEALGIVTINNPEIAKRVKKINSTYNYIGYNFPASYNQSIKPIKVIHFHPLTGKKRLGTEFALDFFKGINKINTPIVTSRLLKIFHYHRIG